MSKDCINRTSRLYTEQSCMQYIHTGARQIVHEFMFQVGSFPDAQQNRNTK